CCVGNHLPEEIAKALALAKTAHAAKATIGAHAQPLGEPRKGSRHPGQISRIDRGTALQARRVDWFARQPDIRANSVGHIRDRFAHPRQEVYMLMTVDIRRRAAHYRCERSYLPFDLLANFSRVQTPEPPIAEQRGEGPAGCQGEMQADI